MYFFIPTFTQVPLCELGLQWQSVLKFDSGVSAIVRFGLISIGSDETLSNVNQWPGFFLIICISVSLSPFVELNWEIGCLLFSCCSWIVFPLLQDFSNLYLPYFFWPISGTNLKISGTGSERVSSQGLFCLQIN